MNYLLLYLFIIMSNSFGKKNLNEKRFKHKDHQLYSHKNMVSQETYKMPKIARKSNSGNFPDSVKTLTSAQRNYQEDSPNQREYIHPEDVKYYISRFIKPLKHMRVSPDIVLSTKLKTQGNSKEKNSKRIRNLQSQTINQSNRYSFADDQPESFSPRVLQSIYSNPKIESMRDNQQPQKFSNRTNQTKSLRIENQGKHKVVRQTTKHFLLPPLSQSQSNEKRRSSYQKELKHNNNNNSMRHQDPNLMKIGQSINQKKMFNRHQFYIEEADEEEQNNEHYQAPNYKVQKKNQSTQIKNPNNDISTYFTEQTFFVELAQKEPQQKLKQSNVKSIRTSHALTFYKIPTKQELPKFIQDYKSMNENFNLTQLSESENFRIIRFKNGIYIGEAKDNKRQGKGLFISQKTIFQGDFHNNFKFKGIQCTPEGVYQGQYINGLREGLGEFRWNNNQIYKGEWKNGLKHGKGIWRNQGGSYYDGQWVNNRQEGYGVHFHQGNLYKGGFKNFLKQGEGEQIFINGDRYKGMYNEGRPNGQGEYTWKNGRKYIGQFKDGLRDGKGIIEQNGNIYKATQVNLKMIVNTVQVKQFIKTGQVSKEFSKQTKLYNKAYIMISMDKRHQHDMFELIFFTNNICFILNINKIITKDKLLIKLIKNQKLCCEKIKLIPKSRKNKKFNTLIKINLQNFMFRKNQNNNRLNHHQINQYFALDNPPKIQKIKLVSRESSRSNSKTKGITLTKNFRKKFQDLYHDPVFPDNKRSQLTVRSAPKQVQQHYFQPHIEVSLNLKFYENAQQPENSKININRNNKYMKTTCNTLSSDSHLTIQNNHPINNVLDPVVKQHTKKRIFAPIQYNFPNINGKPKSAPLLKTTPPSFVQKNSVEVKMQNGGNKPSGIRYTPLIQNIRQKPKTSKLMNFDNISEKQSIIIQDSRVLQTIEQMSKRKRNESEQQLSYKNFLEHYYK